MCQNEHRQPGKRKFHVIWPLDTPAQPCGDLHRKYKDENGNTRNIGAHFDCLPQEFHFPEQKKTGNFLLLMEDYL